jgi:hypothetical protein
VKAGRRRGVRTQRKSTASCAASATSSTATALRISGTQQPTGYQRKSDTRD